MACESNMKRVTLELGIVSPFHVEIVRTNHYKVGRVLLSYLMMPISKMLSLGMPTACCNSRILNQHRTVNAITARTGQVCFAASRVYVQEGIAKTFIKAYVDRMKAAADGIGDPQDPTTKLGPLADEAQYQRVRGFIERGKKQADLIAGGVRSSEQGYFMEPTVFMNPQPDAEIYKEEIFGPVSIIQTFVSEEEVLKRANDTSFGLMAGVFTQDINRALRMSSHLQAGVVGVNCVSYVSNLIVVLQ